MPDKEMIEERLSVIITTKKMVFDIVNNLEYYCYCCKEDKIYCHACSIRLTIRKLDLVFQEANTVNERNY